MKVPCKKTTKDSKIYHEYNWSIKCIVNTLTCTVSYSEKLPTTSNNNKVLIF